MEKTVKMDDLQQKLVKELLEQDMEFIQKEGIPSADNEIDRKGLIRCMEAEKKLLEKLEE